MDSSDPWPVILGPPPMEPLPYLPYLTPCLGWPALLHNRSGSRLTFTSPACTVVSPVVCHALPISSPPVSAFHVPPPVKTEEAESRDEPESVETTRDGSEVPSRHFFSCPHCNYRTDRKNNLRRHVATMHHSTPEPLMCCNQVFHSKAAHRAHTRENHRSGFRCPDCGKVFPRRSLLQRHSSVHTGVKDHRCGICSYSTSHKSNLERHRKVHSRQADLHPDFSQSSNRLDEDPERQDDVSEFSRSRPATDHQERQVDVGQDCSQSCSAEDTELIIDVECLSGDNHEEEMQEEYLPKKLRMAKKYQCSTVNQL